MLFGALEAGGTKMVCAVGTKDGELLAELTVPTNTPDDTLPQIVSFFRNYPIQALGIACFGPIDLNPASDTYGYITTTPKLAWRNFNICGYFKEQLQIPVGFDTDVNGSVLGEATFGCAKGLKNVVYYTVGTGIGAGIISEGRLLHGMLHPEGGHFRVISHPKDTFEGICPYHKNCLEGMASGPSIEARWGMKGHLLSDRNEVWEIEAYYLAQAAVNCIMLLSPQKIIFGGGVMHQPQLIHLIREQVKELIAGYLDTPLLHHLEEYIVLPSLEDKQGILGALQLAKNVIF